ncbi:hypothetical protein AV521_43940 [Streptomyces sp. IMTB 2501]|uniref:antibiotic biosynthesis monooxygenase n=1 Tax=Streptomyces sp. IMTB 2501 TaxID=1776340 RepID=UPI00096F815E|nr:antibiotic biosynthesis monooxygenase [Streptomyces sp. IMTB 2501]OLZ61283.1 hypothetical protein AV521_43940 [Streptomyces sp. IMTB 2501]
MKLRTTLFPLALGAALLMSAPAAMADTAAATADNRGDSGVSYTAIASYENIPAAARTQVIAAAQKEAYDSLDKEPGTLAVHIVPDPKNDARIVIAGTFVNKGAYEAHEHGVFHRRFLRTAAGNGVTGPDYTIRNTSVKPLSADGRTAPSHGDSGSVLTVVAEFDNVQPQYRDEFLRISQADGYGSLTREPGTLGFHCMPDPADPTRFVFLETFKDLDAFNAHKDDGPAQDFLALVAKDHIKGPGFFITNTNAADNGFGTPGAFSVPNQDV